MQPAQSSLLDCVSFTWLLTPAILCVWPTLLPLLSTLLSPVVGSRSGSAKGIRLKQHPSYPSSLDIFRSLPLSCGGITLRTSLILTPKAGRLPALACFALGLLLVVCKKPTLRVSAILVLSKPKQATSGAPTVSLKEFHNAATSLSPGSLFCFLYQFTAFGAAPTFWGPKRLTWVSPSLLSFFLNSRFINPPSISLWFFSRPLFV